MVKEIKRNEIKYEITKRNRKDNKNNEWEVKASWMFYFHYMCKMMIYKF